MELGEASLSSFVECSEAGTLPQEELFLVLRDLAAGLSYIHQLNIIHRDIKPENAIRKDNRYKLADFGVSKQNDLAQTFIGSDAYLAPEVLKNVTENDIYTKAVDIWSLGVLAFKVYFGCNPFFYRPVQTLADYKELTQNIASVAEPEFTVEKVIAKLQGEGLRVEAEQVRKKLQATSKTLLQIFK